MYHDFKNIFGNDPILGTQTREDSHINIGIILNINIESQTMNISLPFKNNIVVEDVSINTPTAVTGAGIRFMPIIGMFVLLHFDYAAPNNYYHIGYYNGDLSDFTNNILGTKTNNRATMRCLDSGEVMLSNGNGSELYLSNKNVVLLKNGDGFFFTIDEDEAKGLFNDLNFTFDNAVLNAGRIKRITRPYNTSTGAIIDTHPKVIRDIQGNALNEFSFSVGEYINRIGIPDVIKNDAFNFNITPTGKLAIAEQIYDEIGTPVTSLKTLTDVNDVLQFMLKMGTGLKIGIDGNGSLFIVNEYTDSHIKFSVGASKSGSTITDLTNLEIKIAKSVFNINQDGELTYTNENVTDANKKTSITTLKDSTIEIKNTSDGSKYNIITLDNAGNMVVQSVNNMTISSNSGGGEEKTLLGESTQSGINSFITAFNTHLHGGPSTPPATQLSATILGLDTNTILSQHTKNN